MFRFNPEAYGDACRHLLQDAALCELGSAKPNQDVVDQLRDFDARRLLGNRTVDDQDMAACCVSALWLLHNFLDESHEISQSVQSNSGSYWHAIMHRREGDFSNSKYWFRRVGSHPVFEPLALAASELAEQVEADDLTSYLRDQSNWDPYCFVDLVEAAVRGRSSDEMLARQIAQIEWQLLFDYCYRRA